VCLGAPTHSAWAEQPKTLAGPTAHYVDNAPGFPSNDASSSTKLQEVVRIFKTGDLEKALHHLGGLLDRGALPSRARPRARFLRGWMNYQLGHYQQASASFFQVRKVPKHPLREAATYFEARSDLMRGHYKAAISECNVVIGGYPLGDFVDECRLVQADAYLALGARRSAVHRFYRFLGDNPKDQRYEEINLKIAAALEQEGDLEGAAKKYRALYLRHRLPTTGIVAADGLRRLKAVGMELPALSDAQLYVRACSLRDSGAFDSSHELYCDLRERFKKPDKAKSGIARKLRKSRHDFLWRNRRYDEVGNRYRRMYEAKPDARAAVKNLYWAVRGFSKAGRFKQAVRYQNIGVERFPNHPHFRASGERSAMLNVSAGNYKEARAAYHARQKKYPKVKRNSKVNFLLGYYAYRAKLWDEAVSELTKIANGRGRFRIGARFFLGKTLHRMGKRAEAAEQFQRVLSSDPDSWYSLVLRSKKRKARGLEDGLVSRIGRWPGRSGRDVVTVATSLAPPLQQSLVRLQDRPRPGTRGPLDPNRRDGELLRDADGRILRRPSEQNWGSPSLLTIDNGEGKADEAPPPAAAGSSSSGKENPSAAMIPLDNRPPPMWVPSKLWNPARGRALWTDFAYKHQVHWPGLPAAHELSLIGLSELVGPLLTQIYDEVIQTRKNKKVKAKVLRWREEQAQKALEKEVAEAEAAEKAFAEKAAAEKASAEAAEKGAAKPAEKAAAKPAEKADEKPAEKADEKPAKKAKGKPVPLTPEQLAELQVQRWSAILEMGLRSADWLALFAAAGDAASVSSFANKSSSFRAIKNLDKSKRAHWTLTYPAAFAPHVWQACWEYDVDPLLMLSIMRAESLFRHDAVSHAGALGLVQVMPATGARVAALMYRPDFRVEKLLEPETNIRTGTFYMGKLLDRYEGQFPLALGSYNGGPHNIGRWLRGKEGLPLEDFVEEIGFDESRRYVKRVSRYYGVYTELYGQGSVIQIPTKTRTDIRSVINF